MESHCPDSDECGCILVSVILSVMIHYHAYDVWYPMSQAHSCTRRSADCHRLLPSPYNTCCRLKSDGNSLHALGCKIDH